MQAHADIGQAIRIAPCRNEPRYEVSDVAILKIRDGCRELISCCVGEESECFPANCLVRVVDQHDRLRENRAVLSRSAGQRSVEGIESRLAQRVTEQEIHLVDYLCRLHTQLGHDERAVRDRLTATAMDQGAQALRRVPAQDLAQQVVGGLDLPEKLPGRPAQPRSWRVTW